MHSSALAIENLGALQVAALIFALLAMVLLLSAVVGCAIRLAVFVGQLSVVCLAFISRAPAFAADLYGSAVRCVFGVPSWIKGASIVIPFGFLAPPLVTLLVCVFVYYWCRERSVEGRQYLQELDSFDEDNDSSSALTTAVERRVAYAFKAKFGELRYNKANQIIANDWVLEEFKTMSMRNVDIIRHLSMTVQLCLMPTKHAVVAARVASMAAVKERRSAVDAPR